MDFIPNMHIGWMNGWLMLAIFYTLFGLFLLSCPKGVVKKLYSIAGWSKKEYTLSAFGKPFSLVCIGLMIYSPIKVGTIVFWVGLVLYIIGTLVMFIALFEYRATPIGEPVHTGIYKFSRNPQFAGLVLIFLGTAIMTGNGLAALLLSGTLILYHFRIKGEERACLAAYGDPYRKYLDSVRRYI